MKLLSLLILTFLLIAVTQASEKSTTLNIPGMDCGLCPITIKKALNKVDGVNNVTISLDDRTATVMYDDTKTSADNLSAATEDAGYPSTIEKN